MCLCISVHPLKTGKTPASRDWLCGSRHAHILNMCCSCTSCLRCFYHIRSFPLKSHIWNREIHSTALRKGHHAPKERTPPAGPLRMRGGTQEKEFLQNCWVGCTIDPCFVLTWCGRSLLLCFAELSCSLLCWSVLLDAVISSVHGQITVCSILSGGGLQDRRDGRRRGERQGWRRL